MNKRDPKLAALLFNECINNRDIDGLVALMTDDHSLICNGHVDKNDKNSSREAWRSFFSMFPDLKERTIREGYEVKFRNLQMRCLDSQD